MGLHAFNAKKEYRKLILKERKNKYIKYGTIIVSVSLLIFAVMYFSFSKFSTTKEFNVINAKVGDFSSGDDKLVYYIDDVSSSTIPAKGSNYVLYKIECSNDAVGKWDSFTWSINISNLSTSTSCKLYFGKSEIFDYTGSEQTFTASKTGYYKLETWGAQGGTANTSYPTVGGYGGYAMGIVSLTSSDTLYINVGGAGSPNNNSNTSGAIGGYNGGGNSGYVNTSIYGEIWTASGGGATHIVKASGLLKNLSSNKDSILIVSGGGAGGFFHNNLSVHAWGKGGSGGGYIGGTGTTYGSGYTVGQGGTQSAAGYTSASASYPGGFGFGGYGVGGNSAIYYFSGGGSGYYGGSGAVYAGAGGGSGYIG